VSAGASDIYFVSSDRLMRWTHTMTWLMVATMVWLESPSLVQV